MPTIESVLAGPQFRLSEGGIEFDALRAASLITDQQLRNLHEMLFAPVKRPKNGKFGQGSGK